MEAVAFKILLPSEANFQVTFKEADEDKTLVSLLTGRMWMVPTRRGGAAGVCG
jgi:hypothetical protein